MSNINIMDCVHRLLNVYVLYYEGPPGVLQSSPVHPSEHIHVLSEQLPFSQGGLQAKIRMCKMVNMPNMHIHHYKIVSSYIIIIWHEKSAHKFGLIMHACT